ncbi:MAG: LysR family transcriptional regulator [Myxococcota bacterium]
MHVTQLRSVDLNLLVVFDRLLELRSVSRAAEELGLSQSAVSRALGRLRAMFEDPLLVTDGRRMLPTARAESLRAPLADVMRNLDVLFAPGRFDPSVEDQCVAIGMPDHLAVVLAPPLIKLLAARGPRMNLVIRAFSRDWRRDLHEGHADIAFGVIAGEEPQFNRRFVFDDRWVVLLRKGHPALRQKLTARRFAALDHGLMAVTVDGPGQIDIALAELGLSRRVRFRHTSPLVTALTAVETDLAVTTTEVMGRWLAGRFPLRVRELPVAAAPLRLPLVWHERHQRDPRHRWLRNVLSELVRETLA